jgi:hypothetical protein
MTKSTLRRRITITAVIALALSLVLFFALNTSQSVLVSLISAVFGFVVASSGIFGAWFAFEQLRLVREDAAEKRKKPELVMSPTATEIPVVGGGVGIMPWARYNTQFKYRLNIFVINKGARTTSSFHVSVFVPRPCLFEVETGSPLARMNFQRVDRDFNGTPYVELILDVERAIQPGTSAQVSDIFIVADPQPRRPPTLWQIRHGEDVFPKPDEHTIEGYGKIQIGLGNVAPGQRLAGDPPN